MSAWPWGQELRLPRGRYRVQTSPVTTFFVDRCVSINSYSDERYEPFNHFYTSGWIRAVSRLNLVLPHKFTTDGSDSNHRLRPDPATHIARLIQGSSNASELSKSESLSYSVYGKCPISRPEPTCALFKRLSLISMCVTRTDRRWIYAWQYASPSTVDINICVTIIVNLLTIWSTDNSQSGSELPARLYCQ